MLVLIIWPFRAIHSDRRVMLDMDHSRIDARYSILNDGSTNPQRVHNRSRNDSGVSCVHIIKSTFDDRADLDKSWFWVVAQPHHSFPLFVYLLQQRRDAIGCPAIQIWINLYVGGLVVSVIYISPLHLTSGGNNTTRVLRSCIIRECPVARASGWMISLRIALHMGWH
jgi:hypothetical protein